eukprot:5344394-Prymnesium_polylepis.1
MVRWLRCPDACFLNARDQLYLQYAKYAKLPDTTVVRTHTPTHAYGEHDKQEKTTRMRFTAV